MSAGEVADDGSVTYQLRFPVELKAKDGSVIETITEVQLHRLTGRDMRTMGVKSPGEASMVMVQKATRRPPTVLDLFDAGDILAITKVVTDFLELQD